MQEQGRSWQEQDRGSLPVDECDLHCAWHDRELVVSLMAGTVSAQMRAGSTAGR